MVWLANYDYFDAINAGTLFIVFKPKLNLHFEQNFERIEMNGQRILTLVIFAVIALCWVFSSYINPMISSVIWSCQKYR